jgi:hypothetical protein
MSESDPSNPPPLPLTNLKRHLTEELDLLTKTQRYMPRKNAEPVNLRQLLSDKQISRGGLGSPLDRLIGKLRGENASKNDLKAMKTELERDIWEVEEAIGREEIEMVEALGEG